MKTTTTKGFRKECPTLEECRIYFNGGVVKVEVKEEPAHEVKDVTPAGFGVEE